MKYCKKIINIEDENTLSINGGDSSSVTFFRSGMASRTRPSESATGCEDTADNRVKTPWLRLHRQSRSFFGIVVD